MVLYLYIFLLLTTNVLSKKQLNGYTYSENDMKECQQLKNDKITCWIGPEMISRSGLFYRTLQSTAKDNFIILAVVDLAFVDMAINLFETSLRKLHITNYLFVCLDEGSYKRLDKRGINAFLYSHHTYSSAPATFGTPEFNHKTRFKVKPVIAAIMLGFTVLLTDVDVVFFHNPIPHLPTDVDIAIQDDTQVWHLNLGSKVESYDVVNTGFMLVRPTYAGVDLMFRTLNEMMTIGYMDQSALNVIAKTMTNSQSLNMVTLNSQQFPCGKEYFHNGTIIFHANGDRLQNKAYIVHNNWIFTKAAKIYRFKEAGLWSYDGNQYYSNKSNKYIYFTSPVKPTEETEYLINAMTIGRILNRIVILPKFHCHECKFEKCDGEENYCALNSHFHIQTFNKMFPNNYREHVFLSNPKVPMSIKNSISPEIHIDTRKTGKPIRHSNKIKAANGKIIVSTRGKKSVSSKDLDWWFGQSRINRYSVLKFHSVNFTIRYENPSWWQTLEKAIAFSNYMQQPTRTVNASFIYNKPKRQENQDFTI